MSKVGASVLNGGILEECHENDDGIEVTIKQDITKLLEDN